MDTTLEMDRFTSDTWYKAIVKINKEVRNFRRKLQQQNLSTNVEYLNEWNELYSAMTEEIMDNPEVNYSAMVQYMFGEPSTLEDFIKEALNMVPPVMSVALIRRTTRRGEIEIAFANKNDSNWNIQLEAHNMTIANAITTPQLDIEEKPSDEFISQELRTQVKDIEKKFDAITEELSATFGTRMTNLENALPGQIGDAIKAAFAEMQTTPLADINKLQSAITEGNRMVDKMTGDIKKAKQTIEAIQSQAKSIERSTEETTDKATKEYLKARMDLKTECEQVTCEIKEERANVKNEFENMMQEIDIKLEEIRDSAKKDSYEDNDGGYTNSGKWKPKTFPDEYVINGETIFIRAKKYQEDATKIVCDSNDELHV